MDADRFDSLIRSVSDPASRRTLLGASVGGVLAALGQDDATGKKKGKKCKHGKKFCDGSCVKTATDPRNCGSCGKRCQINAICNAGQCQCKTKTCDAHAQCCASGMACECFTVGNPFGFTNPSDCKPINCPVEQQCIGPKCQACCPPGSTCDRSTGTCLQ
jgi:Stigma-specific protein, Stig1